MTDADPAPRHPPPAPGFAGSALPADGPQPGAPCAPLAHGTLPAAPRSPFAFAGLALLACAALFFHLGGLGLTEPSEGRYADIGRAMADSGDWVVPRLNGIPHVEKPPFAYWMVAFGVRLFGPTEFGVRCLAALFGVGVVLLACGIASRLWDRTTGLLAGLFVLVMPEFFAVARSITTDVFLTFWATAAMGAFLRWYSDPAEPRAWRWAYWACLGMGMLAKGPVVLAVSFLPVVLWLGFRREWARLRGLRIGRGLAIAAAFLAPWLLLLERSVPGATAFLVFRRAVAAFGSAEEFHGEPVHYFVPVVLFGCIPAIAAWPAFWNRFARRGAEGEGADAWAPAFLALWSATIFVFFSLSASKLLTYILPITIPLALGAARVWSAVLAAGPAAPLPRTLRIGLWILLGLLFAVAAAIPFALQADPGDRPFGLDLDALHVWRENLDPPFSLAPARPLGYALAGVLAAGAAACAWLLRRGAARPLLAAVLALLLLAQLLGLAVWRTVDAEFNSIAPLARALAAEVKPGDEVACWRTFPRSLSFYLGRPVPTIEYDKRNLALVADRPETRELCRFGREEMLRHVYGPGRAFLVMRWRYWWNDDELRATTRLLHQAGGLVVIVPKGQE